MREALAFTIMVVLWIIAFDPTSLGEIAAQVQAAYETELTESRNALSQ